MPCQAPSRVLTNTEIRDPHASPQEPALCLFELSAFQDGAASSSSYAPQGGVNGTAAPSSTPRSKLVVTSLSWSSTGQTIAAAYGRCGECE